MSAGFSIESLNKAQREAVLALNGPILILAGAGTGKTRTVTCRMSALLENGVDAENVLAVTFTNKSAAEMAERVMGMVGKKRGKALTVCTFHSLCLRILKRDIESLGYKKKFAVMAGGDQTGMIRQLIVRKGGRKINLKPAEVMSEISKAKNAELPLSGIEDDLIAEIAVAYQNELRAQNAVDFDDLLLLAERVLREYPEVRGYWQDKFRYVTVDEFQDTNSLQMKLLQQLVGEPYNICVVGDDDQSIYGWRGAQVANILQFERFFPNPKIIRLEENYRSTQAVLEVANSLIRHNVGRREKKLRPTIPGGDLVRLVSMPGDQEESEWIVSEIVMQREEGRVLEDFAILFRTNGQIRKMEEVLREEKIPYRMVGAQSFYDRKEVRDVLSYVQVLNQPELDIPLLRILNTPPRGIGNTTSMAALDCSREKDQSIWETLIDGDFLVQVSKKVRNSIQTFTGQVEEVRRSLVDGVHAGIAMDQWLREMDFHEWLMRQCKTDKEKDARREGVSTTIASLTEAIKKGKSLNDFLDQAALDAEKEDDLEKKSGVTLITLHAAKGLEYPIVYLVGLEEGILPHKRSLEEGTRDEERRLLYVGITRAQEKMTMTYCATRVKWGKEEACEASSFIRELNPDWVHEEGYEDIMGAEASEEELRGFFSAMSAILDE
ncbi:UvrD-helicase domain-containing protein [Akkermansiaceae bacterium]|nr:UvrD-helicase domain-containing protein [Akkermansiaceae bacterium]MDA7861338.1 UvrD-helicase domain-containing protein [Akkermansiaceae bacterium]MDB4483336.1 UvrD-helicase domain-containing protein [Akkermansiaceae bacterium]MDB4555806.1 UvrD-helicase domain-containing protein [Akkermansiaceae bacterium]MDB4748098.1 UvrD-helicase domain-containing protein [Akkermansiaceae bacterium]